MLMHYLLYCVHTETTIESIERNDECYKKYYMKKLIDILILDVVLFILLFAFGLEGAITVLIV